MLYLTWWDTNYIHVSKGSKTTVCGRQMPPVNARVLVPVFHSNGSAVKQQQGLCFEPDLAFCDSCVSQYPQFTKRWPTVTVI